MSLGVDHVWYDDGAEEYVLAQGKKRSMTDFNVHFEFKF